MDLLLLCRAESEAVVQGLLEGVRGWSLTETGGWQADRLADRLARDYRVAVLYSSPLEEARETAARIGRTLGLTPQSEADLRELDCGALAGQPLTQLHRGDIFTPFPGGESCVEMHMRVVRAINHLVEAAVGRTIAVVTHPGPIQAFLLAFLRYAIEQRDQLRLRCDPASLHQLCRGVGGRKEIARLNDTGHLLEDAAVHRLGSRQS